MVRMKIEEIIFNIILKYDKFVNNNEFFEYPMIIGHNLKF